MTKVEKLARVMCLLEGKDPDRDVIIGDRDAKAGWTVRPGRGWELHESEARRRLAEEDAK